MTLTKQERLSDGELFPYFQAVYQRNAEKYGFSESPCCLMLDEWTLEGWIDGPVTFIVMKSEDKQYTGWSKFDNTGRYHEVNGIYRAFQKAVDKYMYEVANQQLTKLFDELPVTTSKQPVDPFENYDGVLQASSPLEEPDYHAFPTNKNSTGADSSRKIG